MNHNDEDITYLLRTISLQIKSRADDCFRTYGLTSGQAWYVLYICEHEGVLNQKELAEHFHVSHPTVVGIVNRLEEKGFLTSTPDPQDLRSRILHGTPLAWRFTQGMRQGKNQVAADVLRNFTAGQEAELFQLLKKINRNLKEVNHEGKKETSQ